jgi:hypothetical protein
VRAYSQAYAFYALASEANQRRGSTAVDYRFDQIKICKPLQAETGADSFQGFWPET